MIFLSCEKVAIETHASIVRKDGVPFIQVLNLHCTHLSFLAMIRIWIYNSLYVGPSLARTLTLFRYIFINDIMYGMRLWNSTSHFSKTFVLALPLGDRYQHFINAHLTISAS